jgi:hypothetical protein
MLVTHVFAVDIPFITPKDAIKKSVKWNCPHLPYENVQAIAEEQIVTVSTWKNKRGEIKISMTPNLFSENVIKKGQKVIEKFVHKKEAPTHIVDYRDCLTTFLKDYEKDLKNHNEKCSGCVEDVQSVISTLDGQIKNSKHFQKLEQIKKIPRLYPLHELEFQSTLQEQKQILRNVCDDKELSHHQTVVAISKKFINQVKNWASDFREDIKAECVEKLIRLNKDLEASIDCNKLDCQFVKNSTIKLSDELKELKEAREKASLAKQQQLLLEQKIYDAAQFEDANYEKMTEQFQNRYYCYFNSFSVRDPNSRRTYIGKIYDFPDMFERFLIEKNDELSPKCKKELLREAMASFYQKKDLLKEDFCQKEDCDQIRTKYLQFENLFANLIGNAFGLEQVKYYCENRAITDSEDQSIYQKVQDLINVMEQSNQCSELAPGSHRIVDAHGGQTPSGIEMKYLLERNSHQELKATLALDFGEGEQAQKMHADVKSCLKDMSQYFKNDQGEVINVEIISPADANKIPADKRPPVVEIGIGEVGMRSHSRKYASDANCGTMTHEVLHLMGLCDEYAELWNGFYVDVETGEVMDKDIGVELQKDGKAKFVNAYNECRSISSSPSIMSSHWDAIAKTVKSKRVCECSNPVCKQIISNTDENKINYYLNNPWDDLWMFKNKCTSKNIKNETIRDISKMNTSNPPMQLIAQNENTIEFINYEFYAGSRATTGNLAQWNYKCTCTDSSCAENFKKLQDRVNQGHYKPGNYCPSGSNLVSNSQAKANEPSGIMPINGSQFELVNQPLNSSLLHPAHFDRIKYGTCESKVTKYSECAKNAYKRVAKECPDIPAYCKDENIWLKSTK